MANLSSLMKYNSRLFGSFLRVIRPMHPEEYNHRRFLYTAFKDTLRACCWLYQRPIWQSISHLTALAENYCPYIMVDLLSIFDQFAEHKHDVQTQTQFCQHLRKEADFKISIFYVDTCLKYFEYFFFILSLTMVSVAPR